MRILEVREGFIKFESEKRISLSSFIQIKDFAKCYVAQVIQVKRPGESLIVYAKILFLYDGTLQPYDKTLPDKNCEITEFTFDIINKTLDSPQPIVVGKFIDNDIEIPMDRTCFDKKMLISSDSPENLTTVLKNLEKQFSKLSNVVIIDMLGNLNYAKHIAGQDFKLPLNTDSLEFMYEDCLNDATSDSKALIKEIFQDLSEYSTTVSFLPFGALKNIVDDMVDRSHIFKLLVLKNKLAKFDKQGYFAANTVEAENLEKILAQKTSIIDLSKLDTIFQNRYLEVICSLIEKQPETTQIFVNVSNSINKKNLKNIITNENLATVFVTHSKFKYINEIKSMFDNFVIEPSFANNEIFKVYSTFLNFMQKDSILIVGEGTNYIPLISTIEEFEVKLPIKEDEPCLDNEILKEESPQEVISEPVEIITESAGDMEINIGENQPIVESSFDESEKVSPIETIDKKSEELIERISEEVETSQPNLNSLFEVDEENIEEDLGDENSQQVTSVEIVQEESHKDSSIVDKNLLPDGEENEIHSEIEEAEISNQFSENALEIVDSVENSLEILPDEVEEELYQQPLQEDSVELLSIDSEDDEDIIEELVEENIVEIQDEPVSLHSTNEDLNNNIEPQEQEVIELSEDFSFSEDISDIDDDIVLNNYENSDSLLENENIEDMQSHEYNDSEIDVVSVPEITDSLDDFGEIVELDPSELEENDIVVELDNNELSEEEILDKEIVQDVDKVFTTMKEDTISDSDLDFIDELNEEVSSEVSLSIDELETLEEKTSIEELPEFAPDEDSDEEFLTPLEEINEQNFDDDSTEILETRKATTPIVPVYEAEIPQEDVVTSDLIDQGDSVTHAKYGNGVVEKKIKYGTKTLYSINFDNIGRRLLDPTLTEIKKM